MKAIITIQMDNDAFEPQAELELARILRDLAEIQEERGLEAVRIRDYSGNIVGKLTFEKEAGR